MPSCKSANRNTRAANDIPPPVAARKARQISAHDARLGMGLSERALRWLAASLFSVALSAALWQTPRPAPAEWLPRPAPTLAHPAHVSAEFLPVIGAWAANASLTQLPDGRLAAAWVAGAQDGTDDASIWFSLKTGDQWRQPQPIANRESTAGASFAHVSAVDDPRLFAEGSWLHLWYVSASIGGLGGRAIQHSISTDAGLSWLKPRQLPSSALAVPRLHLGAGPLGLRDGGIMLPLFSAQPTPSAQPEAWLRLAATGQMIDKIRLPTPLTPANPQSPSAQLRLNNGHLLLAGNPPGSLTTMQVWRSSDQGQTWASSKVVDQADGDAEFTHPALLQGRDGLIHLTYTWRRQRIKHLSFSVAWLVDGAP